LIERFGRTPAGRVFCRCPTVTGADNGNREALRRINRLRAVATTDAALADLECHTVSNYPRRGAQILNNYQAEVDEINLKISRTVDSLSILTERKPRPADYDKRAADLRVALANYKDNLTKAATRAQVAIELLKCFDKRSEIDKLISSLNIHSECVKAEPVPISATRPATTGAQVPEPPGTALAGVKFTFLCR
jgi:hypothetical protein